jgi:hypothetical protein
VRGCGSLWLRNTRTQCCQCTRYGSGPSEAARGLWLSSEAGRRQMSCGGCGCGCALRSRMCTGDDSSAVCCVAVAVAVRSGSGSGGGGPGPALSFGSCLLLWFVRFRFGSDQQNCCMVCIQNHLPPDGTPAIKINRSQSQCDLSECECDTKLLHQTVRVDAPSRPRPPLTSTPASTCFVLRPPLAALKLKRDPERTKTAFASVQKARCFLSHTHRSAPCSTSQQWPYRVDCCQHAQGPWHCPGSPFLVFLLWSAVKTVPVPVPSGAFRISS